MKKIVFYVLVAVMVISLFSCNSSTKSKEDIYVDTIISTLDDFEGIATDLVKSVNSLDSGEIGLIYHKEICGEFIKSAQDLSKAINGLEPPSKAEKMQEYLVKGSESLLKATEILQIYIDTDDELKMQEARQAYAKEISNTQDYFLLATREAGKLGY